MIGNNIRARSFPTLMTFISKEWREKRGRAKWKMFTDRVKCSDERISHINKDTSYTLFLC